MKTLLISTDKSLFAETGPTYDELIEAARHVDEVHIIVQCLKKDKLSFKKITGSAGGKTDSGDVEEAKPYTLFLYPTNSKRPLSFVRDTYSIARFELTLKFHLIVDLISAEGGISTALAAYWISWKYGKHFLMGAHKTFFALTTKDNIFTRAVKKDLLFFLYKKAAGIRVPSQEIGEEVNRLSPAFAPKIYILPFISDIEEKRQAFTHVDIHKKYKRFNIILLHVDKWISFGAAWRAGRIVRSLRRRYPRIGLVVVSRITYSLWNFPQRLLLPRSMVFAKRISDLTSYYRTANVFIDTTDSNEDSHNRRKGISSELIDAALAGCPIVASEIETSSDIVHDGENGFIVDSHDYKRFAKKVIDILETNGLREQMRFAKFNISEIYGKSLDGYGERLAGIWQACKSIEEKDAHLDRPQRPLSPTQAKHTPAITLLMAERVKQKMAREALFATGIGESFKPHKPSEGEFTYIFDLNKVKITLEEAMKEAEKVPEKHSLSDDEILEVTDEDML